MEDLTIALVQMELAWEDWDTNRNKAEMLIGSMDAPADLILLPEMFGSGFTMQPGRVAQMMDGPAVKWMSEKADSLQATLMGSLVIQDDGDYYNRLLSVHADGTMHYYDKRHLFTYAKEDENYRAGQHRLIDSVRGWKVCPLVCYDLRFPVWSRNTESFDLLIYVANWPKPRINAWKTLLQARAIENLCFTAGLNRVGTDANGLEYPGRSIVCDHSGQKLVEAGAGEELVMVTLDAGKMKEFRESYNFLADRDIFILQQD